MNRFTVWLLGALGLSFASSLMAYGERFVEKEPSSVPAEVMIYALAIILLGVYEQSPLHRFANENLALYFLVLFAPPILYMLT